MHKWQSKDKRNRYKLSYRLSNGPLRSVWLRNLRRENPRERANTYVCSAHFAPDCFEPTAEVIPGFKKRKTLKPSAVPTMFAFTTKGNENKTRLSSVKQIRNRTRKVWRFLSHILYGIHLVINIQTILALCEQNVYTML